MKRIFILGSFIAMSTVAGDKGWKLPPETARFERGPGDLLATAQCVLCHSADYIATQPPMNRAAWTATVQKMKDKFGAPIPPENIERLAEYLVKTYGTEKAASRKSTQ